MKRARTTGPSVLPTDRVNIPMPPVKPTRGPRPPATPTAPLGESDGGEDEDGA